MKKVTRFSILCIILLVSILFIGVVTAKNDDNLKKYEKEDKEFKKLEIGDMDVYWQQRMVDDAVVEGDFIVYQFDKNTEKLLKKEKHWRDDLPEHITPEIKQKQAESMVMGEVLFSQLMMISPESVEFPIEPAPTNPCWVVKSQVGERRITTVIDAVEGTILGYGIPPPYEAYSLGGPDHGNCDELYYDPWALSAGNWFTTMGYDTQISDRPIEATVMGHIDSTTTALFYELAHGGSDHFLHLNTGCGSGTVTAHLILSSEVETWIADRTKMPFAFIGSCEGMCNTGDGSFSYEFRKGTTVDTVTVGYCHMDWTGNASLGETYQCDGTCWGGNVLNWQEDLFNYLNQGWTAQNAFNQACADNPQCGNGATCVRFAGDTGLTLVPNVIRGSLPTADAGPDQTVEQTNLAGTSVTLDGSGSSDPDGALLTYAWTWSGGSATGATPTVSLPLGTTVITLVVDDGQGTALDVDVRTDTVSITVRDTTPPDLTVPANIIVEQASAAGTVVSLTATASDICDASPVITSNAPAVFPLGTTTVTFTATDDSGNVASGTMSVSVVDTTPPVITAPPDVTVEQTSADGTPVDPTALIAIATDICDASPDLIDDAPAVFPLGTTTVTFTATDDSGNVASGTMSVSVVDTTPPVISVSVTPDTLWPPNHKMVNIEASVRVSDICDSEPDIILVSITSDEPDDANGIGDGETTADIQASNGGTEHYKFRLRAERAGDQDGRVYTITYQATDDSGNSATSSTTVLVPLEM
ncbi:MAG: HYR domain-containing protein [Methanoregulaceae archaeon]|nr:HYR domain-containing protein [Methanoregulaceae archaeon]